MKKKVKRLEGNHRRRRRQSHGGSGSDDRRDYERRNDMNGLNESRPSLDVCIRVCVRYRCTKINSYRRNTLGLHQFLK